MVNMKNILDISDDEILEMDLYEKGQIIMANKRNDKEIHSTEKPYIVISNVHLNMDEDGIIAVPISREETKVKPLYHVKIKANVVEGYAICENIIKVPKTCINRIIGKITDSEIKNINGALAAICENHDTNKNLKAYEDAAKKMKKLCEIEERGLKKVSNKELKETIESETNGLLEKIKASEVKITELTKENDELKKVNSSSNLEIDKLKEDKAIQLRKINNLQNESELNTSRLNKIINVKDKTISELNEKITLLEKVGNDIGKNNAEKIEELERENERLKEELNNTNSNSDDDFEKEVLREKQKLYEETNKKYEDELFKSQVIIKRLQKILMTYEPDNKYVKMDI